MEQKLVLRAVFFFAICLTRSLTAVFRNEYVELGTTVSLNCTNTKIAWQDLIFVIWKISLRDKNCTIAMAKNDSDHDTCQDGKRLNRTADGVYQLIIPHFSFKDEGNYTCDISYESGGWLENIIVSGFAKPKLTGWLENENGDNVAVCEAKSNSPVSVSWEAPCNSSIPITQAYATTGQLFTVISRFHLDCDLSHTNLTCVATVNNNKHIKAQFSNFELRDAPVKWHIIILPVCAFFICAAIVFVLCKMRKHLKPLSIFRKICCKTDIPATTEEKPQQPYEPEELQPYASYVQRVNSIYNSSADLFSA
ncbi:cell surface glycoprotein CD200 receptor 1-A isoform X2 [Silurus meridionalis]|uniref:Ig-like domain-containing protein n=1 Tax=Silurus meridionalis TaxID=175797 RepID=A0A8T0BS28_SILME|nr:cell surface glycoprotein CD200 receptor 1-A isoform X2 [Silurus meridionalis]KAF7709213.1 hypothetical protein HF521_016063 [Silurus meridionalis]